MRELGDHFFEMMKARLQHFFNLNDTISLHDSNGTELDSFADIGINAHFIIVKKAKDKWLGLRRTLILPKIIPINASKVERKKEIKKVSKIKEAEMEPEKICHKYNISYGQFLYLSSKYDVHLRNFKDPFSISLDYLLKCKGEILFGLEREIVDRICIAHEIQNEVTKSQYIWLWCLLIYNTIPLEELVKFWKCIFNPYELQSVGYTELRQTLMLLSKCCQPLEVDFRHRCFAHIIIEELRKANCLTSNNDLIVEKFVIELMKETKLLPYLNNSIMRRLSLEIPLALLWEKVGEAIEHKQTIYQ